MVSDVAVCACWQNDGRFLAFSSVCEDDLDKVLSRFIPKQLDYSLSISIGVIVDSGCALVKYHAIEISSS